MEIQLTKNFYSELEKICQNNTLGSIELAAMLVDVVIEEAENAQPGEFQNFMEKITTELKQNFCRPEFVILQHIIKELSKVNELDELRELKQLFFKVEVETQQAVGTFLIENNIRSVVSLSRSRTVLGSLEYTLTHNDELKVIYWLESAPLMEAFSVAEYLKKLIRPNQIVIVPDAEMGIVVQKAQCVLLGADRILKDGTVINKIGSLPLSLTAKHFQIPVLVAASTHKLDREHSIEHASELVPIMPSEEIYERWPEKNRYVYDTLNYYFEPIPAELIDYYGYEHGVIKRNDFEEKILSSESGVVK